MVAQYFLREKYEHKPIVKIANLSWLHFFSFLFDIKNITNSQYLRYFVLFNKQHGFWMNSICRSQIEKKIVVKNWSIFAEIVVKDLLSWWFVRNADYFDVDQTFWAWLGLVSSIKVHFLVHPNFDLVSPRSAGQYL